MMGLVMVMALMLMMGLVMVMAWHGIDHSDDAYNKYDEEMRNTRLSSTWRAALDFIVLKERKRR